MLRALSATVSCCQPYETVRSSAISVVGDAVHAHDARFGACLEQRRILVERGAEEPLVAEEHDHELGRRLELLPVALLPELRHVLADEARMPHEVHAPHVVVLGLDGVEVGLERRLRVDDEVLAAGKLHDEVGSQQSALVVALARLLDEVAVGEHPCELDDALELHLAPAAAHVRCAERRDETARLLAEALLSVRHVPERFVDRRDGRQTLVLERLRLPLEPLERLLDRLKLRRQRARGVTRNWSRARRR